MKFTSLLGIALTLVALCATPLARAQQAGVVSSHQQAATDLFNLIGGAKMAEIGAETVMPMVRSNPALAPYEDVFRAWYQKVFAEGALEREVVNLYVSAFSEEELRGLIDFYHSPLGAKALAKLPELARQATALGQTLVQNHLGELDEMIAKAKKEREGRANQ